MVQTSSGLWSNDTGMTVGDSLVGVGVSGTSMVFVVSVGGCTRTKSGDEYANKNIFYILFIIVSIFFCQAALEDLHLPKHVSVLSGAKYYLLQAGSSMQPSRQRWPLRARS
jgi:hypothetical protein